MNLRQTMTLSLAAAFLVPAFVTTASAATTKPPVHHPHAHAMHVVAHGHTHATTSAPNADHSADALNAQSLAHAQGATP
jgi:hypothetical protein